MGHGYVSSVHLLTRAEIAVDAADGRMTLFLGFLLSLYLSLYERSNFALIFRLEQKKNKKKFFS